MSQEELAAKILQRAVQLDKENRLTEANVYYLEALSILMDICRDSQDEEKKKFLRSKIDVYMRRAETLKKQINDEKARGTYHEVLRIENDSTGHSYDSVFGRFLNKEVTSIVVQDPYVRAFHQCQNFLQVCELFVKKCENLKQISLLTGEDPSDSQKQWLQQLSGSLRSKHNICLTIQYSSTLHDRQILLNNGWIIKIGRGLDYFKAVDNKFCIGSHDYDLRPCYETNVDIFHKKNVQFKNTN
ncbi:MIT domain-containing protein 1 [Nilaparvata lugens]|uniref:MIT domain-containing protein 1 n=1 Tax=Nilaparvata lugens TaxID=108931 RepID=UPI000B984151|nr:MIT domain-containing protein 1 [Nilaparvata lugens]